MRVSGGLSSSLSTLTLFAADRSLVLVDEPGERVASVLAARVFGYDLVMALRRTKGVAGDLGNAFATATKCIATNE